MQCPICGTADQICGGGPAVVRAVDGLGRFENGMGSTKRYKDEKGNVFSMTAEYAKRVGGFKLVKGQDADDEPEAEPETKAVNAAPQFRALRNAPGNKKA